MSKPHDSERVLLFGCFVALLVFAVWGVPYIRAVRNCKVAGGVPVRSAYMGTVCIDAATLIFTEGAK